MSIWPRAGAIRGIHDPRLTEYGHVQAEQAARHLGTANIRRIITSPYTRALQTVEPIARQLQVPVIVHPIVRERFGFACDVGTPRSVLATAWPGHDFSRIDEIWWPAIEEPAASIVDRATLFRAELAALPDWSDTLVVSHWGFILCMTGQSIGNCQSMRCDPTAQPPEQIVWRV